MSDLLPREPDADTLARFRNGDVTALAAVFRLYGGQVHRLARKMLGNPDDAEDATQEIFIRAFEQAAKFHGRSGLFTWLYRLAVRHCLNKMKGIRRREAHERRASQEGRTEQVSAAPSPLARLIDNERNEVVAELLQSLPPHYRSCLLLREVDGLSYSQIAEVLEIPAGTVMSRLARARRTLRARLPDSDGAGGAGGNNAEGSVVQTAEGHG